MATTIDEGGKGEILAAIGALSRDMANFNSKTDQKFETVFKAIDTLDTKTETGFKTIDTKFEEVLEGITNFADQTERRFERLETDVSFLKSAVSSMKNVFVSKGYLDDKLSDFREDLLLLIRRENGRLFSAL